MNCTTHNSRKSIKSSKISQTVQYCIAYQYITTKLGRKETQVGVEKHGLTICSWLTSSKSGCSTKCLLIQSKRSGTSVILYTKP